ncbi:MAG: hypothetical protein JWO12_2483 [Frankiales bacterium]|nr:hypothetical protein [Frankiales bacterium]
MAPQGMEGLLTHAHLEHLLPRTRRRALLATVALGASLLAVAPASTASAADAPAASKPGTKVKLLRGEVKRGPGANLARAQRLSVVPGAAATPRSTWNVTYTGFTAQAQASFQAAVNIWAGIITSNVPINVAADFTDLGPGVLGYAGPHAIIPVSGAGDGTSWYPVALANALKRSDQLPARSGESGVDIEASFSSTEPGIYYGTDGNVPANDVDFESIVLHELGHGLGFTGSAEYDSGAGHYESPRFVFDYFNVTGPGPTGGQRMITLPNGSTTLGAAMTSNNVFWDGANAKAANGGNRVQLYAPDPWEDGSSIAHLDEQAFPQGDPNSLMTPYVDNQEVVHSPGPIVVAMMRDMGWNAVLTAPAAPTGVTAEPNESSVDLSWDPAVPNGSPVTGYTIYVNDGSTTTTVASPGSGTTRLITGLDDAKTYTFTVQATNAIGTGPVSAPSAPVEPAPDTVAPTVAVTSVHASGLGKAVGDAFTFTGADPGHAHPTLTYTCSVDGAVASACTSPTASPAFADGTTHTFTVTATDVAGNVSDPVTVSFLADGVLPTISTAVLPTYTLAPVIGTTAGVADANGVRNLDFRYRRAAFSGGFGAFTYPAGWQAAATLRESLPAVQGYTYCFSARARDKAGNESAWSAERCTATGLDDRGLAPSAGWVREAYYKHFLGTDTRTSTAGATLTRTGVSTLRLALVAVKCAKCGVVGIYFNGRLIKNVDLRQPATAYQTVFPIISFPSVQVGTVVIKPLTKGAANYIDGLVMSRV